jgi:hypothetical protein
LFANKGFFYFVFKLFLPLITLIDFINIGHYILNSITEKLFMEKFTKLSIIAVIIIFSFRNQVKAQSSDSGPLRFGIGVDAGIPTGQIRELSIFELGFTGRVQYRLGKGYNVMLTSGYYNFYKNSNIPAITTFDGLTKLGNTYYVPPSTKQAIIPVKLGVKKFFSDNIYVSLEGGVGFETQYGASTKTIVAPGIGWATDSFDAGLRYENFAGQGYNYGIVGLRVAYSFGF